MEVGRLDDLRARLRSSVEDSDSRPLALLVGSGISAGAVASAKEITDSVVAALGEHDGADLLSKLGEIQDPAERYQAAFAFLSLRKSPVFRDRIIRIATLRAYDGKFGHGKDFDPKRLMEYESDVDSWLLPAGVESVGRIWAGLPPHARGPIVTTNFDPLCEIAIKRAGGSVMTRVMDADGAFLRDSQISDASTVVHLHGFWRESATLSMTSQLTMERPALAGSLRALLSQYTVVVAGYGGWNDAVMRQLLQVVGEQSANALDVIWCYFGSEGDLRSELSSGSALSQLSLAPGNIQFYSGIDSNVAFPDVERAIAGSLEFQDSLRRTSGVGSLIGWLPIRYGGARGDGKESVAAALTFFNGRLPNWNDASSELIPRRDIVQTIRNNVAISIRDRRASMTVISGPSGEGKTTALMQCAALLAASNPDIVVLFSRDGLVASVQEILDLPTSSPHLLIVDEGFRSIDRLREIALRMNEDALTHIHVLVASRDTDWSGVGGFTFAWGRYVDYKMNKLRGMSRPDAAAIVKSWERLGDRALGDLASVIGTDARVDTLMAAALDEQGRGEGAFLGALLATRFGDGLVDHIRELLVRLGDRHIQVLSGPATLTLQNAFYLLSVPQVAGVKTMSERVLAQALGISKYELVGSVLLPLGDEAAISYNSRRILVRHRLIASASLELAEEMDIELDAVVRSVVRAAVEVIEEDGYSPDVAALAYLSSRLDNPDLAVAAAHEAMVACPSRLSYRTSYSRALRAANLPEEAAVVCEQALPLLITARDASSGSRPLFTEWGVAEGNLGNVCRNAVLAGVALQDATHAARLTSEHAITAVVCLALALRRTWERKRSDVFLSALGGLVYLADGLALNPSQERWISESRTLAFERGASIPTSGVDAAAKLQHGCLAALASLESPFPSDFPRGRFEFRELSGLQSSW